VGLVRGLKGLAAPHVFCSLETAQQLLRLAPDQATYLLVRCRREADVPAVVGELSKHREMTVLTSPDLSLRTRCHWLFRTGGGVALGLAGALGLLVGAVITSQTLYAATVSALREYAVLRALGIPRWRLAGCVLAQAWWIGLAGLALALPVIFILMQVGSALGATVHLPAWLLGLTLAVTLSVAMLSGLTALRSLRLIEPAILLR
jgi:putative ABC transport system permease protein